jgi:hypothetical protein
MMLVSEKDKGHMSDTTNIRLDILVRDPVISVPVDLRTARTNFEDILLQASAYLVPVS